MMSPVSSCALACSRLLGATSSTITLGSHLISSKHTSGASAGRAASLRSIGNRSFMRAALGAWRWPTKRSDSAVAS